MTITADRLSLFVNPLHTQTFDAVLELIRDAGLHRIGLPYGVWSHLGPAEMAHILEKNGLGCDVVNLPARIGRLGDGSDVLTLLSGAMDLAVAVGAGDVQFHFKIDERSDPDSVIADVAAHLGRVVDLARDRGIGLLLENNFDSRNEDPRGSNPARSGGGMTALRDALGADGLGFCYDPANFVLTGQTPFPDEFEMMRPDIRDVHIKDCAPLSGVGETTGHSSNAVVTDSLCGPFGWTRLGEGSLPWSAIVSTLVRSGYDRSITLEPVPSPGMTLEEWVIDSATTVRHWISLAEDSEKG